MYQTILFDLDGTLTNPALGITNSLAYALEKFNIEVTDKKELYRFIGPPLQDSFENFYHFSKEDSLKAVDFYRDYFRHKGLYENEVYQGIPDLLERLKVTMGQGIISFDTQTKEFARFVDVGCNVISSLSGDGKSLLYVGTDGNGVHFVSTDKKKVVRSMRHETGKDETLRSNSVYSVLVDKEGLIWVGFYQLGLDYTLYQSGLFSTYTYAPFFDSRDMPVRALAIKEKEKLIGSCD